MIELSDSQFQNALIHTAVKNGKLSADFIPKTNGLNTEASIGEILAPWKQKGFFPIYSFGSDFTEVEQKLIQGLTRLKEATFQKWKLVGMLLKGIKTPAGDFSVELTRMNLLQPKSLADWVYQKLLMGALKSYAIFPNNLIRKYF